MGHYAKVENDRVTEVIVAKQDFIDTLDGEWIKTSYNTYENQHANGKTPLRGNYAGIGYTYDRENDVFYDMKPFESWILNTSKWNWEPPIPRPDDEDPFANPPIFYDWDEEAYQANGEGWQRQDPPVDDGIG